MNYKHSSRVIKFIELLFVSVLSILLWNLQTVNGQSSQIVHQETKTGGSSNLTTVKTSVRLTGANGHLYLAAIATRPRVAVTEVSGLGLNWTFVKSQCSGRNTTQVEVWMAQGTPTGNDTVRAAFANAPLNAVIAVSRYSGVLTVDPIGNFVAGNTNGTNGSCLGGVDGGAYAFNLTTTANGALIYGAATMRARTHTPGAGYAERVEAKQGASSDMASIAVEDKSIASPATSNVNGTFSGTVDWAVVALELKPQVQFTLTVNTVGSGSVTLNPTGGIYAAGTVVTLTAMPMSGSQFSGWSGALNGLGNPATITMNGNKNVTANFTTSAIVHEETKTGSSSNSTMVTSANITGANNHLYLAAITTRWKVPVVGVTGLGLNWTLVKSQCAGQNSTGIEVWKAQGTPSGDGAVTATLAGAPSNAVIAVSRYSGVLAVNPTGNLVSGNTIGANGACTGGTATNAYSFNLTTTVDEAMVYAAATMRGTTHTPGGGFIERAEILHGSFGATTSVAVEDKSVASASTAIVSGSFSGNADWAVVALELKPKPRFTLTVNTVGSGTVALDPQSEFYEPGTVVTLTATPASGFQLNNWSGDLNGPVNPITITMNGNKNVTATFMELPVGNPIVHEQTQTGQSSNSTTVATTGTLTGVNGHLYLAAIATRGKVAVNSVTGLGLTWMRVKAQCAGQNSTGIEVWKAQGTSSGNGVVTATLASAPSNAVIAVSRYSGAAPASIGGIGNVVSGNSNGTNGACTGGVTTNAYSFNLLATTEGTVVYGAATMRGFTHTPGAGYTERTDLMHGGAGVTTSVAVEDKLLPSTGSVIVNGAFSANADWAVVGVEIKPRAAPIKYTLTANATGSGSVALDPSGGTYNAGTVVTLTAAPGSGFQFSGWSGDLSGSTNPNTITMNSNKNVTAIFTPVGGENQVAHQETQTGSDSNATSVATTADLIGVSGHLYLAAISTRPKVKVHAVSGLGLTWTLVKDQCSGRELTGVEVWKAQGTPSGNGPVTATLESSANNAVIAVSRYSGVAAINPIGNMIAGNTNGVNGTCEAGPDTNFYSFDLTTTVNGAVIYCAVAMRSRTHIPGAGYTERAEVEQGLTSAIASVAVQDKGIASASTVTVNGSFNGNVKWAVVAFEIKPQLKFNLTVNISGAGSVKLNPPGGFYNPGTVVTLTATPNAGAQFTGWSGNLTGTVNPRTITMNGNKNVTATFTGGNSNVQVTHEETQTGSSSESATVTSASLVGASGHLYLAAISCKARANVISVTGLGMNWSLLRKQCSGHNSTMVEIWMAQGTPSGNGPVTATLHAAPSNAVIAVSRYSNVDGNNPIGNVVSGNTNGAEAGCENGTDTNAYSNDLDVTINGAMVYGAAAMRRRSHTPGAGFTERGEIQQGEYAPAKASVAVQDKNASPATIAVNGSFSGDADWAMVGVEIRPGSTAKAKAEKEQAAENSQPVSEFALAQNYPNPFWSEATSPARSGGNPSTMINFALPEAGKVTLRVFNETGQLVRTLVDREMAAGRHTMRWNARNQSDNPVAAGVYFYQIIAQGRNGELLFSQTRRMTLLK